MKPSRRVSRIRNWKTEIRDAKDSATRFDVAMDYFRAMARTADRSSAAVASKARSDAANDLIKAADDLARRIPADRLENGWRTTR